MYGCMVAGSLLAVLFGFIELRRRHPLLDIRVFLNPYFGTGAATITLVFLGWSAYYDDLYYPAES